MASPKDPLTVYMKQWLDLCQHAAVLARGSMQAAAHFADLRALRGLWLASLRKTMDGYLRSPAFLQLMEHNVRMMAKPTQPTGPS